MLLFILVVTTLLSQFCSTALLSDIKSGMIIANTSTLSIPVGKRYDTSSGLVYQGINYWTTKPPLYPAFAEYAEPPEELESSFYTGKVNRAMLPFSNAEQRSLINAYSGVAFVTNVQTVCVRPQIEAQVYSWLTAPMLVGKVSGSPSPRALEGNRMFYPIEEYFNCSIPINLKDEVSDPRAYKEWSTAMCRLGGINDATYGGPFLFLNLTNGDKEEYLGSLGSGPELHGIASDRADGVWQHMKSESQSLELSVSMCWVDGTIGIQTVDISSNVSRTEPALSWNIASEDYDSEAIRIQLGAVRDPSGYRMTSQQRDILDLSPNLGEYDDESNQILTFQHITARGTFGTNVSVAMCSYCSINENEDVSFWAHRGQNAVFQDILTSTSNPALALQAQYFTLLSMSHYDMQPLMDVTVPATLSFFTEVLMPGGWNGYISVVVVFFAHVVCVVLSTVLFLVQTRYTLLGNVWSAVGQVSTICEESAGIVATAVMKTDGEIRERTKKEKEVVLLKENDLS